jgi:hypothetical protein
LAHRRADQNHSSVRSLLRYNILAEGDKSSTKRLLSAELANQSMASWLHWSFTLYQISNPEKQLDSPSLVRRCSSESWRQS